VDPRSLPTIGPLVRRCVVYCHSGLTPGSHLGMPSPDLPLVISLDGLTRVSALPDPTRPPGDFAALVGGLHLRPAVIDYGAHLCGIQLDLRPQAARRLFGLPPSELTHGVVELADLIGAAPAAELLDRVHTGRTWPAKLAALDSTLGRRLDGAHVPARVERAWDLLVGRAGSIRIDDLADTVGWSRRRLHQAFLAELGVAPKEVARLARFSTSQRLLHSRPNLPLASVAAECGYCDQAHMAREWRTLAGVPASAWLAHDLFPLIQDGKAGSAALSPA
jgi:AraC-like DNA-binding protein